MKDNDVYVIKRKNTDHRVLYDAEYALEQTLYYFQRSQELSAEQIRWHRRRQICPKNKRYAYVDVMCTCSQLSALSLFLSLSISILIAVIFLLSVRVPPLSNANLLSILRPPPVNSSFSLFYSLFPSPIPLTFLSSFFSPSLPSLYRHSRVPHDWSEAVHRQSSSRSSRCVRQSRYCSVHYLVINPNTHLTRRRTIHSSSLNIVQ